jgi:hypothetical protein
MKETIWLIHKASDIKLTWPSVLPGKRFKRCPSSAPAKQAHMKIGRPAYHVTKQYDQEYAISD